MYASEMILFPSNMHWYFLCTHEIVAICDLKD